MSSQPVITQAITVKPLRAKRTFITDVIRNRVIALWVNPNNQLTIRQIAQTAGISRCAVKRIISKFKPAIQELAEEERGQFKRALREVMPVKACVEALGDVMTQDRDQKSRIEAIRYRNHLMGVHTEVELRQREALVPEVSRIVMPPGTSVRLRRVTVEEYSAETTTGCGSGDSVGQLQSSGTAQVIDSE